MDSQGETYSGEFANIGDGLIVVLDKHYKIKHTLSARHLYRGFGTWTPSSVQMLTSTSTQDDILIKQTLDLAEGDFLISMTDGIWGELESTLISEVKNHHRDIGIESKSFENLFNPIMDAPYPSSFEIAQLITNRAMSQSVNRRKTLVNLIHEIEEQHFNEKSINTVNEALAYFAKTGKQRTAKTFKAILFEQGLNDGIMYFDHVEIPLDVVMHDLRSRTVGDCSTINVTRIPYHLDELIRCFIKSPEQRKNLSPQLEASIQSEANLKQTFKRLSLEVLQTKAESKISEVHFEPAFEKDILNQTHLILIHYFRISRSLDNKMSYQQLLTHLSDYINQEPSLKKEDIQLLLDMLNNKIKPQTGFFYTLLGANQSKLYKAFQKKIELQFLEKPVPSSIIHPITENVPGF